MTTKVNQLLSVYNMLKQSSQNQPGVLAPGPGGETRMPMEKAGAMSSAAREAFEGS